MRGIERIVVSRVSTYEQQVAYSLRTHDQQRARLSSVKIGVALVAGKGERFRHFIADDLDNIQKFGSLMTSESGDG